MCQLKLVIGNKNYSSWSLRPWLVLKQAQIPFEEIRIALYTPGMRENIRAYSPAGKVPVLVDGTVTVWDSLAICEYLAERFPDARLWPDSREARALARAISAEMHAGFAALRQHMSMNCRRSLVGRGKGTGVREDIARIEAIWNDCRTRFGAGGDMLFGRFSIADAMFAPIALRFQTYGVELPGAPGAYAKTILALPAIQEWMAAARAEKETIPQFEPA
jgi:glutathione S-transferase